MCIHRMKIVHRDLKSANCLVNNHKTIKICDFGLSRVMTDIPIRDSSSAGTPEWMAPELIRNEPVTEKCDIFSLGVIMWELCTLSRPWEGVPPKRVCLRSFISLLNIMFFSLRQLHGCTILFHQGPLLNGLFELCFFLFNYSLDLSFTPSLSITTFFF
jgi:serine/threonine protein kinase